MHPYLAVFLIALGLTWAVTLITLRRVPSDGVELAPVAALLQYLLVVLAAVLAAVQLRRSGRDELATATFRWWDAEWTIADGVGGSSFWHALGAGVLAMELNVVLLILVNIVAGSQLGGAATYLEWLGIGLAVGVVLGILGAVVGAGATAVLGRLAR